MNKCISINGYPNDILNSNSDLKESREQTGKKCPTRFSYLCPFLSKRRWTTLSASRHGFFPLIGQTDFKPEISLFCTFPKNSLFHLLCGFLASPSSKQKRSDKQHMNNGVFFIFKNFSILIYMTIVYFSVSVMTFSRLTDFFQMVRKYGHDLFS